jgi:alanine-glyoxylate transaminase/serine-glyoxylate transaminase/serine-pyruvate transaminase
VSSIKVDRQTDANDVILHAYNEYGISLGAGLGPLNGNVFRIGHLGWLNETMVLGVLAGVELAMRDLNVLFQAGAGVGAAISAYSSAKDNVHKLY